MAPYRTCNTSQTVVAVGGVEELSKRRGCGRAGGRSWRVYPANESHFPRNSPPASKWPSRRGLFARAFNSGRIVEYGVWGREPGRNLALRYWIEAICLESIQLRIFYTLHIRPDYITLVLRMEVLMLVAAVCSSSSTSHRRRSLHTISTFAQTDRCLQGEVCAALRRSLARVPDSAPLSSLVRFQQIHLARSQLLMLKSPSWTSLI
jgi:hypothetical protein